MTLFSRPASLMLAFALAALLAAGCVPKAYRAHPDFKQRAGVIAAPGVLPVDVTIVEVSAGGVTEVRKEWCDMGTMNIAKALNEQLTDKNYQVKPVTITPELEPEIRELKALYRAVDASIRMHTYNPAATFPDKVQHFDYSVGPVNGLMETLGVDAFLVVNCVDQVATAGRKAVQAASVVAAAFAGVALVPAGSFTQGSVAIIDASGTIIWYSTHAEQWMYDLRNYDSAHALVAQMLNDLPKASQ